MTGDERYKMCRDARRAGAPEAELEALAAILLGGLLGDLNAAREALSSRLQAEPTVDAAELWGSPPVGGFSRNPGPPRGRGTQSSFVVPPRPAAPIATPNPPKPHRP